MRADEASGSSHAPLPRAEQPASGLCDDAGAKQEALAKIIEQVETRRDEVKRKWKTRPLSLHGFVGVTVRCKGLLESETRGRHASDFVQMSGRRGVSTRGDGDRCRRSHLVAANAASLWPLSSLLFSLAPSLPRSLRLCIARSRQQHAHAPAVNCLLSSLPLPRRRPSLNLVVRDTEPRRVPATRAPTVERTRLPDSLSFLALP